MPRPPGSRRRISDHGIERNRLDERPHDPARHRHVVHGRQDRDALADEVVALLLEPDRRHVGRRRPGTGEREELADEVGPFERTRVRRVGIHDLSTQRRQRHGGQRRKRVVGGEQHRQRFQPEQPHIEVVDRTLVDPCCAPEHDVHLAEPQAIERDADATTVAAAELDVRDVGPCPIEDPGPRQAPFAEQVDDHRVLAGRTHLEPDPIVERDQLARGPEQPLAVRGERHPARGSREQGPPDPPLQLPDVPAEGLLRNEQPRCGGCEVQVLGDRDEIPEQPDVEFAADRRGVLIHAAWMLMPRRQVLDAARRLPDRGGAVTPPNNDLTSTTKQERPRWIPQPSEP